MRVKWETSDSSILRLVQDTVPVPGVTYDGSQYGLQAVVHALNPGTATIRVTVLEGGGAAASVVQTVPLTVVERWTSVSAGTAHTCAIAVDSLTYCWGAFAALGTRQADAHTPVLVAGMEQRKAVGVSSGEAFSCAKSVERLLFCWGSNEYGQVGNGTLSPQYIATVGGGGSQYDLFDVGEHHVCATGHAELRTVCWGDATLGQLGLFLPPAPTPCGFVHDGTGSFFTLRTCYLTPQGPVMRDGIDNLYLSVLSAGGSHTCAIGIENTFGVHCWGLATTGQLGLGFYPIRDLCSGFVPDRTRSNPDYYNLPCQQLPKALGGLVTVSAGFDDGFQGHSCGVAMDGQAFCWGKNDAGQLGTTLSDSVCTWDGDPGNGSPYYMVQGSVPCVTFANGGPPVQTVARFTEIGAGARTTCALGMVDSLVYCWGSNGFGELGTSVIGGSRTQPAAVWGEPTRYVALSVGAHHACAISHPNGALYCWGNGSSGQLGQSIAIAPTPIRVVEPIR